MDVRHLKTSAPTPRPLRDRRTTAATSSSYGGTDSTRVKPAQGSGAVLVFPIGLLITIVVFVFRLLGANGVSDEVREPAGANFFRLANSFYQNEDFDEAITYYDLAIRENSGLGRAFNNRGRPMPRRARQTRL